MYCSVIMGDIFSFISISDWNNLRKFITTTMYNYVRSIICTCTTVHVHAAQYQSHMFLFCNHFRIFQFLLFRRKFFSRGSVHQ